MTEHVPSIHPASEHEGLIRRLPLAATVETLRSGQLDLAASVEEALERIERLEPTLRAMVPEPARRERLHAAVAEQTGREAPLAGALVGVKDIIAVDGLPMRGGSALPPEAFADMPEAAAVKRLREAGALILGKTVTTEFAGAEPGATANPRDTRRTPGGSSSGSAAAVAAGYCPLALGTQTVGSVIRPAAFCGVVGYKPTRGRLPIEGVLAYSPSVDHVGWFTQDVAGARLAGSVLLDGWDASVVANERPVLGVPDGPYLAQVDPEALEVFEQAIEQLIVAGIEVRRVRCFEDIERINVRHRTLTTLEFGESHAERFARYGALYRGTSAEFVDTARRITEEERREGLEGRDALRDELHRTMDQHGIDAWAMPAAPGPAPLGLRSTGNAMLNLPWTHSGLPAITVPAGRLEGAPLGLQLAARAGTDEVLLQHAEAIESLLA